MIFKKIIYKVARIPPSTHKSPQITKRQKKSKHPFQRQEQKNELALQNMALGSLFQVGNCWVNAGDRKVAIKTWLSASGHLAQKKPGWCSITMSVPLARCAPIRSAPLRSGHELRSRKSSACLASSLWTSTAAWLYSTNLGFFARGVWI